jgi:Protein of unknown function (DUF4242)
MSRRRSGRTVTAMPRYLVERAFSGGWGVGDLEEFCRQVLERNLDGEVTWLHSYVSDDRTRLLCVYEAPSPEAVRRSAARNGLPVDSITSVRVVDPYHYRT